MIGIGNNTDLTFKLGTSDVEIYLGSEKVYPDTPHDYSLDYFTIEALESGDIYMDNNINSYEIALNDSSDVWSSTTFPNTNQLYLTAGDKLHIRCQGTPKVSKTEADHTIFNGIGTFKTTFRFKVYGNIMSLLYGGNFVGQTTFPSIDLYDYDTITLVTQNYNKEYFLKLFSRNTNLVDARNLVLPATTLTSNCYSGMFSGCTSLTTAPALPATTLASSCYTNMFSGCTSLVNAPELPTTTLADYCYQNMFRGCTSLVNAPVLPTTTLAIACYYSMFNGCTSLTTAPVLPATTLANLCYYYMFKGCTNLNYIKAMFTTTPSTTYTNNWVNGVASSGTFVKNKDATWNVTGINGIPTGWTVVTE